MPRRAPGAMRTAVTLLAGALTLRGAAQAYAGTLEAAKGGVTSLGRVAKNMGGGAPCAVLTVRPPRALSPGPGCRRGWRENR
jgi:hypothetical protein